MLICRDFAGGVATSFEGGERESSAAGNRSYDGPSA